jgi:hypothetical protein
MLELNLKHIRDEDHGILDGIAISNPDLVKKLDNGYIITERGLSELNDVGPEGLEFVIHYGLMGGYHGVMLSSTGPYMADFDIY